MHRSVCIAFVAALAGGCGNGEPKPEAKAAEPAKAEPAKIEAEAKPADTKPAEGAPKAAEPLTQEEIDLIESDPAELTPALRRKRAFALRKKIMQNPESESAKALEEMRRKVEAGEITPELPPSSGLTLSAPVPAGHPPSSIPEDGAKKPTEAPPADSAG
jgi:hypothetical protein